MEASVAWVHCQARPCGHSSFPQGARIHGSFPLQRQPLRERASDIREGLGPHLRNSTLTQSQVRRVPRSHCHTSSPLSHHLRTGVTSLPYAISRFCPHSRGGDCTRGRTIGGHPHMFPPGNPAQAPSVARQAHSGCLITEAGRALGPGLPHLSSQHGQCCRDRAEPEHPW